MHAVQDAPQIVRMEPGDVEVVSGLEAQVSPAPWSAEVFRDCLSAHYECWVFRLGEIAGYVIVSLGPGEAHLLNIAVAPDQQRRGFGRQLLEKGVTVARQAGAERVFLEVRPSNLRARAIYEKAGFEFLSIRKKYYGLPRPEDALVYALAL